MRLSLSILATLLIAAAVFTACNSNDHVAIPSLPPSATAQAPGQIPPGDGARRITTAELKDLLAKNEAIVIDTRSEGAYKQGHIKGARLISATEILQHIRELPRDKMIVTYCS